MDQLAYSIPDLVKATCLSTNTIYREIKAGRLRVTKCGTRTIVTRQQAEEWLASLQNAG